MRKRLRKIAKQTMGVDVVLLGEQADIIAQRQYPLEQPPRVITTSEQNQIIGEPKAAGNENPFTRREPVDPGIAVVAPDQATDEQAPIHRFNGGTYTCVLGG